MTTLDSLFEKIENAKNLDFGTIIDQVISLFKKVWQKGLVLVLIIVVCAGVAGVLFNLIGLSGSTNLMLDEGFNINTFIDNYSKNVIYAIPQNILISTLTMAFLAAFYRICKSELLEENLQDDYFYFFKHGYFSKLLTLGMIHTGISTLALFLFVIPAIYVYVPLGYISVFFAFNPDLSEIEILKASFKLGNKKWLISFGTMFVASLMGALGILGCGIGILFTISIAYLPVFFIYKEVVGFEKKSAIDEIGNSIQ
ncbi:hypothetical protein Q4566_11250 [Tamlana sp. 2_MG-2023]|uniref:hypothetical protein n=1 Tax=unclassified Tamlana TaxID=2614803 RepID=UPI0026E3B5B4|nr:MULTISPECIES: hypothetical protein [unclassified Tamlana]MDO6760778.1 hypothetical protein [Tamlana sp. 2_MG-2023]MDO6791034.1 hypothetical protein [Tamlana sp. 1_MG-2023]